MKHQFTILLIERDETAGPGNYTLAGLPEGKSFKSEDNYVKLRASWLKVEGIGFSTNGCEFSEYRKLIEVRQETDNGSAHISFVDME